jgi:hypothetical protein
VVQQEAGLALGRAGLPLASHRLEQVEGAGHVALDEGAMPIDRAVHMAFGRQDQHQIGIDFLYSLRRGCRIRKVNMQLMVAIGCLGPQALDAAEVAGTPHFVEIKH